MFNSVVSYEINCDLNSSQDVIVDLQAFHQKECSESSGKRRPTSRSQFAFGVFLRAKYSSSS